MRLRLVVAVLACITLASCGGLTSSDTVVKAGGQTLTAERLGTLIGNAKIQVDASKEHAEILSGIWSYWMRLGYVAAHGDSLTDMVDVAIGPILNSERVFLYTDSMAKMVKVDSVTEEVYNASDYYSARHILLAFPGGASEKQKDSVRSAAKALKAQLTSANFAELAKKRSADPGSAAQGGELPVFRKPEMVPEFSNATAALKPGEISGPVETMYGMHIIQRRAYADARAQFVEGYAQNVRRSSDSTMRDSLMKEYKVEAKDDAGSVAKAAVKAKSEHRTDKKVLASYKGGDMTVSEFIDWVGTFPPRLNIEGELVNAADSLVSRFVRDVALQEVYLQKAKDAKIDVPEEQKKSYRESFVKFVDAAKQQMGISIQQLADSAKSTSEKEKLAAKRIEAWIDKFMAGEAPVADIPAPIKHALDVKHPAKINSAAIDKAVEAAKKARAAADSARAASMPPMPGMPQMPPPAGGQEPPPAPGTKKGGG
jgi:parvulin-like peptidyl-prolyl isomerase